MKKILQYSRHFMRSKGRHGTHSPFVYAFVEQVMRAKTGARLPRQALFPRKALNLLYKTLAYLKPGVVYADETWLAVAEAAAGKINPGIRVLPLAIEDTLPAIATGTLILTCAKEGQLPFLKTWLGKEAARVLVFSPHTPGRKTAWDQLSALPEVRMSLDYWYFGLLLNDPAFKSKQYFRLR